MKKIVLREFEDKNMILLKKWLYEPHVAKWYTEPLGWIDEVEKRNSKYNWIKHFIVEYDGELFGFCQYYEYYKSGETWHGNFNIENTYSIDYMIGDISYIRKGFGKEIVKELIKIIKGKNINNKIIVQPEVDNIVSCKTLLSAGFKYDIENKIYVLD